MRGIGPCLVLLAALDLRVAPFDLLENLEAGRELRRIIINKDTEALRGICAAPSRVLQLKWREQNEWTDACANFGTFNSLARYWKVEILSKYRLLFGLEIPITVSIVILS